MSKGSPQASQVSEPVQVAPGVVQQKVGNKTLTSTAQVFDPNTGQAQMLAKVPDMPVVTNKDFQVNQKVVQVDSSVKSSWSKPKSIQVTAVQDGDGLKGDYSDGSGAVVCRITSIDAPETAKSFKKDTKGNSDPGQKYGDYSARTMEQLIKDKKVEVSVSMVPGDNKYGRNLCLITVNGDNLSTKMVEAGAAYVYRQFVKPELQSQLDKAEASARKKGVGVWQEPNAERPWDYRRRTENTYRMPGR